VLSSAAQRPLRCATGSDGVVCRWVSRRSRGELDTATAFLASRDTTWHAHGTGAGAALNQDTSGTYKKKTRRSGCPRPPAFSAALSPEFPLAADRIVPPCRAGSIPDWHVSPNPLTYNRFRFSAGSANAPDPVTFCAISFLCVRLPLTHRLPALRVTRSDSGDRQRPGHPPSAFRAA